MACLLYQMFNIFHIVINYYYNNSSKFIWKKKQRSWNTLINSDLHEKQSQNIYCYVTKIINVRRDCSMHKMPTKIRYVLVTTEHDLHANNCSYEQ